MEDSNCDKHCLFEYCPTWTAPIKTMLYNKIQSLQVNIIKKLNTNHENFETKIGFEACHDFF